MARKELIDKMVSKTGMTKVDCDKALTSVLDAVKESLIQDGGLSLVGFGTFSVVDVQERVGHDPRTGEQITVQAHRKVKFKPSKDLKDAVQAK